ncbi:MAG: hypothetical protein ACR2FS_12465, partial [Phormidesmis sp.]
MISSLTSVITRLWRTVRHKLSGPANLPWLLLPVVASALVLWSAIAPPAQAYQVQVLPSSPKLGDTLSVVVQGERSGEAPTVSVGDASYPTFLLPGDRYRALIPTSPNTTPGRMTLQVSGPEGTNNIAVNIGDRSFPTQYITLSPG